MKIDKSLIGWLIRIIVAVTVQKYEDHLQKLESMIKSMTKTKSNTNSNESNPLEELRCTLKVNDRLSFVKNIESMAG